METIFQKFNHFLRGPEIAIFHEFHKPPYGGGNTFLLALEKEFKKRNLDVGRNKVGSNTKVALFNSYNFNFKELEHLAGKFHPKMVHRVDGPIGTYRGEGVEIDKKIWEMNHNLADITVFQSNYSLEKHLELGLIFNSPTVITNASDPDIFNRNGKIPFSTDRKVRLIATSWSKNPKKGGPLLASLDEHLDHSKYELTFVGRTDASIHGAHIIPAVSSEKLAEILKNNDIYIAPSQDDPCSNGLVEALSCGLPAVYLRSGGHPELVKDAGVGFNNESELMEAIEKVSNNYNDYQGKIITPNISVVADKYLEIFK